VGAYPSAIVRFHPAINIEETPVGMRGAKEPRWHVNVTIRPALSRCRRSAFPSPGPHKEEAAGKRNGCPSLTIGASSGFPTETPEGHY
jgi:hypothetical protein